MYAVIKTGGKQHKVKAGDVLEVELLGSEDGEKVTFQPLLVVDHASKSFGAVRALEDGWIELRRGFAIGEPYGARKTGG